MPIDRAFALIEKKRLAMEKVPRPEDWVHVVRTARVVNPFKICALNFPLSSGLRAQPGIEVVKTKDFKTASGQRLKKVAVAKIRSVLFQQNYKASFQAHMDGPWATMDLLKRGASRYSPLICEEIGRDFIPVKAEKKMDIDDPLQYVDEGIRLSKFYLSISSSAHASNDFC